MNEIEVLKQKFEVLCEAFEMLAKRVKDLENEVKAADFAQSTFEKLQLPKKPELKLMDFSDALKAMKQGKKVSRDNWSKNSYIKIENDVFIDEGKEVFYEMSSCGILGDNWYIVE